MSRFQRLPFSSRSVAPGHSSSTSASLFETGLGYQSHTSTSLLPQPSDPSMFSHYNTTTENQRRAAGKNDSTPTLPFHRLDASTRVFACFHQPPTIGLQHSELIGAHQPRCRYLTSSEHMLTRLSSQLRASRLFAALLLSRWYLGEHWWIRLTWGRRLVVLTSHLLPTSNPKHQKNLKAQNSKAPFLPPLPLLQHLGLI